MDLQGNIAGFLKISLTDDARDRVQHEAEVLQELESAGVLHGQVPRVLYAGNWSNKFLLLTTAAPLKRAPVRLKSSHFAFLETLHGYRRDTIKAEAACEGVQRRWYAAVHQQKESLVPAVSAALKYAHELLRGATLPCALAHGDFTPWNLRSCGADGQAIFAFDWEAARPGIPIQWDSFHFQVQCEGLLGKRLLAEAKLNEVDRASLLLFLVNSICESIEEDFDGTSLFDLQYKLEILVRETEKAREIAA
jgi:hypothetical protein